jgi:hypothetical protein
MDESALASQNERFGREWDEMVREKERTGTGVLKPESSVIVPGSKAREKEDQGDSVRSSGFSSPVSPLVSGSGEFSRSSNGEESGGKRNSQGDDEQSRSDLATNELEMEGS